MHPTAQAAGGLAWVQFLVATLGVCFGEYWSIHKACNKYNIENFMYMYP